MVISEQLILRGTGGLVEGETFRVDYGETVILGRSSSCDISLKKCEKYLLLDPEERESEKHFQTVSRKHVRISFFNSTSIEIEDLSSNGTFLDGEQIQKVVISDIKDRTHELLLGTKEKFVIEWGSAAGTAAGDGGAAPDKPERVGPAPDLERPGATPDKDGAPVPEAVPVDDDEEHDPDLADEEGAPEPVTLKPADIGDDDDDEDEGDGDDDEGDKAKG